MTTAVAEMKVSAIAPWFGSKRNLAPIIVETLGRHRAYWEPFCGSMAVLLAKPESSHETVNDLHGDVTNLAIVLQSHRCGDLYDRCGRAVVSEAVFHHAIEQLDAPFAPSMRADDAAVERAYWFMVRSWWGRNGTVGLRDVGDSLAVRFTPGGGHGGVRWRSAVASIPAWHARLRSVLILNRDGFEILASIEDVDGVAIYLDPPYFAKNGKYVHEFTTVDHQRLADAVQRFKKARVVVSYYDDPRLEKLYPGWSIERIAVKKSLVHCNGRGTHDHRATEVLLVNQAAGLFG